MEKLFEELDALFEGRDLDEFVLGVGLGDGSGPDGHSRGAGRGKDGGIAKPSGPGGFATGLDQFGDERMTGIRVERFGSGDFLDGQAGTGGAHDLENFARVTVLPLRRKKPQIDDRFGMVGHDVEFCPPADCADAERGMREHGIGDFFEMCGQRFLQVEQPGGQLGDGVLAALRTRAMRSAPLGNDARSHVDLVFENHIQAGWFANHDEVERLPRGQRLRPVLSGLLSHKSGKPDLMREMRQKVTALVQRPKHGGHRTLRIARTAAVEPSLANLAAERIDGHTGHTDRVRMRSEKEPRFSSVRGKSGHDIRTPRMDLVQRSLGAV